MSLFRNQLKSAIYDLKLWLLTLNLLAAMNVYVLIHLKGKEVN